MFLDSFPIVAYKCFVSGIKPTNPWNIEYLVTGENRISHKHQDKAILEWLIVILNLFFVGGIQIPKFMKNLYYDYTSLMKGLFNQHASDFYAVELVCDIEQQLAHIIVI